MNEVRARKICAGIVQCALATDGDFFVKSVSENDPQVEVYFNDKAFFVTNDEIWRNLRNLTALEYLQFFEKMVN